MQEKGIQVIDRAFDILEILSIEKDGLGVTEIANRLGLHKSTVHRILSAMLKRGYIQKINPKGVYKLGLKLVEISSVYLNNVELKTEAMPYLRELTSKLGQTAHLAILDGGDAVYIDKVDVVNNIRLYSQIGRRIPIHCSGLGKCLIAGLPDVEIQELLSNYKFARFTSNTITTKEELLRQVGKVRKTGWAIDDEEHDEGIRCIAASVFDYRDKIIAAISVSGSSSSISRERDEEVGSLVLETALKISERMGYKGGFPTAEQFEGSEGKKIKKQ